MQIISCSALILNEAGDQVLISRRAEHRRVAPGLWEVVGGRLEFGEEPSVCLAREVREELGVEVVAPVLFGVYSCLSAVGENQVHLVSLVYTCRIHGEPVANPYETADLRWVAAADLDGLAFAANCRERVADYFQRRIAESMQFRIMREG